MKITIWGCRGSLPSPGLEKNLFGGNTSCIQLEHDKTCIILDGGSGIQRLGDALSPEVLEVNILLTHLHIDHIMGLGYFKPFYNPNCTINIWGPASSSKSLVKRLKRYFSPPFFPVQLKELPAVVNIFEIDNSTFKVDDIVITSEYLCHPGPTVGFRLENDQSVVVYMPDHEPALGSAHFPDLSEWCSGFNLAKDADILFHDAQYTSDLYKKRMGWGHSSIDDAVAFGKLAKAKKIVLVHHDPSSTDAQLIEMAKDALQNKTIGIEAIMGKENAVFQLP
jgi:phosphoribosyl 1,2-cyclic phosphodiesterase